MHSTNAIIAASAYIFVVHAATHQIQVGTNGLRVFDPATITAAVGDTVQFLFVAGVLQIPYLSIILLIDSEPHCHLRRRK